MTTYILEVDGKRHTLPQGAQVLTLPRLGLAFVKFGKKVRAVSARGLDPRWNDAELEKLWREWSGR